MGLTEMGGGIHYVGEGRGGPACLRLFDTLGFGVLGGSNGGDAFLVLNANNLLDPSCFFPSVNPLKTRTWSSLQNTFKLHSHDRQRRSTRMFYKGIKQTGDCE